MKYNPKIKGKERILHAAVKSKCGQVVIGRSHADCFYCGENMGLVMSSRSCDQGFVTNKGRYVDRAMAAKIAKRAKQIYPGANKNVTHLLSEDVSWCGYIYLEGYQ